MNKPLLLAALAATLFAIGSPAAAQPAGSLLSIWFAGGDGSGSGDWNTGTNWNPPTVPNVQNDDFAVINGGGTASLTSVAPNAGGLYLGAAGGDSGTLIVGPGGSVEFEPFPGAPADGGVRVGEGGLGILQMTGGSLTAVTLASGGDAGSFIDLSGSATLSTGSATLTRTTSITGPGVGFSVTGALNLSGDHTLDTVITGATHSTIDVNGAATLGGALSVDFSAYSPTGAEVWDLLTAPTISGNFTGVNVVGASFDTGQALAVRTVPSAGEELLQLFLQQQLVLEVNRATGVVELTNPGSTDVLFDGYSVRSAGGSLAQGAWNTLQSQLGAGWTPANASGTSLNELIDGAGTATLSGGQSLSLGAVYQPAAPTEFDTEIDDLVFSYTGPDAGNIPATVSYTGAGVINDLTLYVDPSTGQVTMRNTSPFNVEIEGYTITSDSDALDAVAWDSLQDQGADAGVWEEANPSAGRVSELTNDGVSPLSIHRSFDLGELVDGGAEDLTFQYLLAGEEFARTGVVVYEAAPTQVALPGDYNNDGVVDAADYTVYRDALGTATTLPGDTSPGGVSSVDLAVWRNNYGAMLTGAAFAIPEPGAIALLAGVSIVLMRPRSERN